MILDPTVDQPDFRETIFIVNNMNGFSYLLQDQKS
jgi:hypothetical protein